MTIRSFPWMVPKVALKFIAFILRFLPIAQKESNVFLVNIYLYDHWTSC